MEHLRFRHRHLEHSHRGKVFDRVIEEAEADCRTIAGISDDYAVLFLQGGASLQFAMIPMNFLPAGRTADYLDTGVWTTKAIKEAKKLGNVHVAFDGSRSRYDHVPERTRCSTRPTPVTCTTARTTRSTARASTSLPPLRRRSSRT